MILDITEVQAKQMAANAINASSAMGMGFLHVQDKEYTPEDITPSEDGSMDFDYHDGRMVKLYIKKVEGGYELSGGTPNSEYQSWAGTYPTYDDLALSVL